MDTAPSSTGFEPGARPAILAKDLGLPGKAMEIADYRCQLGTLAGELCGKMANSDFAGQDFSGITSTYKKERAGSPASNQPA